MFGLNKADRSSPALVEGTSGFYLCRIHTALMSPQWAPGGEGCIHWAGGADEQSLAGPLSPRSPSASR